MQDLDAEILELATILSPAGLRLNAEGGLAGSLAPGGNKDSAYLFMPLIRNFNEARAYDGATVEGIISDPALRGKHIKHITDLVNHNEFDGVFIDYRGFAAAQRDNFTRFIAELGASLSKRYSHRLGVVVSVERGDDGGWISPRYDWAPIGAAVDYFQARAPLHPLDFAT